MLHYSQSPHLTAESLLKSVIIAVITVIMQETIIEYKFCENQGKESVNYIQREP